MWLFSVLLKTLTAFIATNIDDLLLLVLLLQQNDAKKQRIITGQYLGFIIILVISLFGSLSKYLISLEYIGLLNLIPLISSLKKLRQKDRYGHATRSYTNFLTVVTLTIGDGTDNISAYIPLLANVSLLYILFIVIFFLLLFAIWCSLAYFLVHLHIVKGATKPLSRFLPYIIILLTILNLNNAGYFTLASHIIRAIF